MKQNVFMALAHNFHTGDNSFKVLNLLLGVFAYIMLQQLTGSVSMS